MMRAKMAGVNGEIIFTPIYFINRVSNWGNGRNRLNEYNEWNFVLEFLLSSYD